MRISTEFISLISTSFDFRNLLKGREVGVYNFLSKHGGSDHSVLFCHDPFPHIAIHHAWSCRRITEYYYTLNFLALFWLAASVQWIFEIRRQWPHNWRLYNNHVKGHSRSQLITSSSRALCCFPSVKKQKHYFHLLFVQCIIKQFGFCGYPE